ncbi:hypothetical protein [Paenibacillus sp. 1_12]|uniref:hypothetical protein n=1 Tax=Paenibacillus sp. 1_12 TaxID=1566278 RepID=UPI0011608698|nr:hypothetical protein [Paenibacillus sp. 1_12]
MKSRQSFLRLTEAILQLIQTSNAINLEQVPQRETSLLAYHRTKQSELLNQLFEVIQLRIIALSSSQQLSPSDDSDNKQSEIMEVSVTDLLTQFFSLKDTDYSPNEEYLLSIERLRKKLFPNSLTQDTELSANKPVVQIKTEIKEIRRSVVSPILHWTKNAPNKTARLKNKEEDFYQIRIGSKIYHGFL